MKKLWIIGAVVVLLFAAIVVLTKLSNESKLKDNPYDKENLNQATIDLLDDENYQNIVLPGALKEKIESGDLTVAYMFSPLCSYCKNFTPKLMPVAEELDIEINQINVLEYESLWNQYQITATPTLIVFEDGKEIARLIGDQEESDLRAFFDANVLN